jgi:hypothetical protein
VYTQATKLRNEEEPTKSTFVIFVRFVAIVFVPSWRSFVIFVRFVIFVADRLRGDRLRAFVAIVL